MQRRCVAGLEKSWWLVEDMSDLLKEDLALRDPRNGARLGNDSTANSCTEIPENKAKCEPSDDDDDGCIAVADLL